MTARELQSQLHQARRQISTDAYGMSLGEVVTLYRSKELVIDPLYQRLFRWDESQKTRFVESVLLGLAVPPIFVFQREDGTWDLLDGLHPVMTILQLTGDLLDEKGRPVTPLVLRDTTLLPALSGMSWHGAVAEEDEDDDPEDDGTAFNIQLRLDLRRARIHVEILRHQCGMDVAQALFERFNANGTAFTPEELRLAMISLGKTDPSHMD
ncbi:DUF262 domain-containing protein [Mitsuaria sp. 7]|uniref:DUF262 domain-containing protein n=1 Tax=Mitsuaria sp. 7 TaxID=1658665 RepID=UPI000835A1C1|nr:DUF262 domain-containing protein [Mitsuaria sp. 7]